MTNEVEINPRTAKSILNVWNHLAKPLTSVITLKALKSGHGLLSTRWKGWLLKFDIKLPL
jgi:hypothetical protein